MDLFSSWFNVALYVEILHSTLFIIETYQIKKLGFVSVNWKLRHFLTIILLNTHNSCFALCQVNVSFIPFACDWVMTPDGGGKVVRPTTFLPRSLIENYQRPSRAVVAILEDRKLNLLKTKRHNMHVFCWYSDLNKPKQK